MSRINFYIQAHENFPQHYNFRSLKSREREREKKTFCRLSKLGENLLDKSSIHFTHFQSDSVSK